MCLVPAPGEFWASRNDFPKLEIWRRTCDVICGCFAKNESLYRRISTKYKSRKLFWRILEDTKQNKQNRGKKTVWILRADRRFVLVCSTCCWNATNSFPPSLSLLPSNPCLFWWIISANSCLLVSNLKIGWKPEKTKRLFKVNTWPRGRPGYRISLCLLW